MFRWQRTGSVLILVVWTICLLSILAVALGSRCAFALGLTDRLEQQLRASYIAASGVQQAAQTLISDKNISIDGVNDVWANNSNEFFERPFGGGTFTVSAPNFAAPGKPARAGLIDQERFINLNTATPEILKQLIQRASGIKSLEAVTIAESIVDWRDKDKEALPSGAEDYYYLGLSTAYECKNGPFESVEELLLVRGVTPEIFNRIRPYITVYGSGAVNINTADATVLEALGLSTFGVQGMLAYRAGEDDELGTDDDRVFNSAGALSAELRALVPAEDANRLVELASQKLIDVRSTAFEVRSVARLEGRENAGAQVIAVIDRENKVLSWEEH